MIVRKEVSKEMKEFVMDSFNRNDMVYCCNNFGDITTGKSCSNNDGI